MRGVRRSRFFGFSLLNEMLAKGFLNSTNRNWVGPRGLLLLLLRLLLLRWFFR